MSDIVIKKPELNPGQVEKSLAAIDTWIHDTADKLNFFFSRMEGQTGTGSTGNANEKSDAYLRSYVQQALRSQALQVKEKELIAQTQIQVSAVHVKLFSVRERIRSGKVYVVSWAGSTYACTAETKTTELGEVSYLGNPYLIPELSDTSPVDTKGPFAIYQDASTELWTVVGSTEEKIEVAFRVYRRVYELPEELFVETVTGTLKGTAETAVALAQTVCMNGIAFNGSEDVNHYGLCVTAADVAEKTVEIPYFTRKEGSQALVRFAYGNSAQGITLNVSGTGAKPVYDGESPIAAGVLQAKKAYLLVYTGALWLLVN